MFIFGSKVGSGKGHVGIKSSRGFYMKPLKAFNSCYMASSGEIFTSWKRESKTLQKLGCWEICTRSWKWKHLADQHQIYLALGSKVWKNWLLRSISISRSWVALWISYTGSKEWNCPVCELETKAISQYRRNDFSTDIVVDPNVNYLTKFLNSLEPPGMPSHKLSLK